MAAPVRVAFDVSPMHGSRTGIGTAVAAMLDSLPDDVDVVPYLLSARARWRQRAVHGERRLPLPATIAHRLWAVADRPRLDHWLGDVDVVHGTNYVVPPASAPQLVSVYDCWFLANPALANPAVSRAGAVLARRVAGGAHVHTSSRATADAVRSILGTDLVTAIHLGPPSVPPPPQRPPVSGLPSEPYVLALGTHERRKNLPRLIDGFGRMASRLDIALLVAGAAGDDDTATGEAIARLPAAAKRRCWLLGRVDDATRSWLLHHAHVIAYPSLDEGFGFPVLEAQTVGVPIVASRAGSIPEIGGGGVEYVDPLDPDSIAGGLSHAIEDEARCRLVEAGRANLDRFSWARTAAEMAELYRALADK